MGWISGKQTENLFLAVARGNIADLGYINKFGLNLDADTTSTPEDVWGGSNPYIPPTEARIHNILSDSNDDTNAGIGAQTLRIYGLDGICRLQTEDIVLNGTTIVTTTKSYFRIFRVEILSAGSTQNNVGTITVTAQVDDTLTAIISPKNGQTLMAIYTIPIGVTAYILQGYASIQRETIVTRIVADLRLMVRIGIDTANPVLLTKHVVSLSLEGTSVMQCEWKPPKIVLGPADIFWRINNVSTSNTIIAAGFDLILEQE